MRLHLNPLSAGRTGDRKQLSRLHWSIIAKCPERRLAPIVESRTVRTMRQQLPNCFYVSEPCGFVQRRVPQMIQRMHIGPMSNQHLKYRRLFARLRHRRKDWPPPSWFYPPRVRPMFQKHTRNFNNPQTGSVRQRRIREIIHCVRRRPERQQQLNPLQLILNRQPMQRCLHADIPIANYLWMRTKQRLGLAVLFVIDINKKPPRMRPETVSIRHGYSLTATHPENRTTHTAPTRSAQ